MSQPVPLCVWCPKFNQGWRDIPNCEAYPEAVPIAVVEGGPCPFYSGDESKIAKGGAGSGKPAGYGGGASGGDRVGMTEIKPGADVPAHIAGLKIPPAWKDVTYDPNPKAALLVKGRDAKGRDQYIYSEKFKAGQSAAKFERIKELDGKVEGIRRENEKEIARGGPDAESASCLKLIMETGIRPGSDEDTGARVQAYGATTLLGKHVVTSAGETRLQFTGKKGVELDIPIADKALATELKDRAAKSGKDGKLFAVDSGRLLEYSSKVDGGGFKTKDFRTLKAAKTAQSAMAKMPAPKTEREFRKAVREVAKAVSRELGNTPTVALQSYIPPQIFAKWQGGAK